MTKPAEQTDVLEGLALQELFDFATVPRTVEELRTFRRELAAMPRIGAYNALLVQIQRPGAHFVATAHEWAKYGRRVKPGAHRLIVLKPYGPVEFVFEVSDTEGAPLPEQFVHPFAAEGPVTEEGLAWLLHRLPQVGVFFQQTVQGSLQAGQIEPWGTTRVRRNGQNVEVPSYAVSVNADLDPNARFLTLAHELGHLFCGHLGVPTDRRFRDRSGLTHESQVLEAESVAWILSKRVGVRGGSEEYVRKIVDGAALPPVDLERIAYAVNKIEGLADGAMSLAERLRGWDPRPARGSSTGVVVEEPTLF